MPEDDSGWGEAATARGAASLLLVQGMPCDDNRHSRGISTLMDGVPALRSPPGAYCNEALYPIA